MCFVPAVLAVSQHGFLRRTYCFVGEQAGTIILLANNNADVHSRSTVGDSALHVAAAQGNVAAINALLSEVYVSTSSTHALMQALSCNTMQVY